MVPFFIKKNTLTALFLSLVFLAPALVMAQFTPDASNRKRINMDVGWKFFLGTPSGSPETAGFNDASWTSVSIPHTLQVVSAHLDNNTDDCNQTTFIRTIGWYRKHITVPAAWQGRKLFLEFEGAMEVTDVWVNGTRLGQHATSGYDPFHFDITSAVAFGADNVLAVKVDNTRHADSPPDGTCMDYILFGGLYRDVFLHVTDNLHVDFPWQSTVSGVTITTPTISTSSATVQVRTNVKNDGTAAQNATLVTTILDANNLVVTSMTNTQQIAAGGSYTFTQTSSAIASPHLWSPSSPYRYKVYTSVRTGSTPASGVDGILTPYGMRWVQFNTSSGFYINGQSLKLVGTNRHQSWPWVGYALPNSVHQREAAQIKSIGANWIRLSHYPHDPAFLDAMDSLGIFGLEEGPTWMDNGGTAWFNNVVLAFRNMIRRDRNHACLIIWNSCINHQGCSTPLRDAATAEDPTRATGQCGVPCPMCFGYPSVTGNGGVCIEHTGHTFPTHRYDGEQRLINHSLKHAGMTNSARSTASCSGVAGWCMYDYNTNFNDEARIVYHGITDLFRIPKFAYYWHQSEMTTTPMVFIASYWTSTSPANVTVFSNCDSVELFVNNVSKGTRAPTRSADNSTTDGALYTDRLLHPPFIFSNPGFQSGELRAVGRISRVVRAADTVRTPGAAASIRLTLDPATLVADGVDFGRIIASVVDNNGTVVPTASNSIRFSLSGPGELIGENPINAQGGMIINLIKAGLATGTATITATSGSLTSNVATVTYVARPSDTIPILPVGVAYGVRGTPFVRSLSTHVCMVVDGHLRIPPSLLAQAKIVRIYDLSGHLLEKTKVLNKAGLIIDKKKIRGSGLFLVKPE